MTLFFFELYAIVVVALVGVFAIATVVFDECRDRLERRRRARDVEALLQMFPTQSADTSAKLHAALMSTARRDLPLHIVPPPNQLPRI